MPARIQMHDAVNVFRPLYGLRILRPSNDEFAVWQLPRWSAQQFVDFRLTVRRIGAHVAQITSESFVRRKEVILLRIKRAVEWHGCTRTKARLDLPQHRPPREAEVDVETRDLVDPQIVRSTSFPQLRDSDGSV